MNSNNWNSWKAYLEELIDPDSIETTSLISKKTLPPELWFRDKMKPDVLAAAERIAYEFFESLDLSHIEIKDLILTGSLASYNWSEMSDFDLHILIDFNELSNLSIMEDYFKEKTRAWNDIHYILLKGYEVEIYIQDSNEPHVANGIYSLMENRWLKQPSQYRFEIDHAAVKQKAAKLMEEIDDVYDIYAEKEYILAKKTGDAIMEKIKRYRKTGLETGGIYSVENLVFKVLRRNDYLKKLSELRRLSYDASMSLFEKNKQYIAYKK